MSLASAAPATWPYPHRTVSENDRLGYRYLPNGDVVSIILVSAVVDPSLRKPSLRVAG